MVKIGFFKDKTSDIFMVDPPPLIVGFKTEHRFT